jgi:hypothetical protein
VPPRSSDCPRCGDPLPLDGRCDCKGTDRDALRGLRRLRRDRVSTDEGYKPTFSGIIEEFEPFPSLLDLFRAGRMA